MKQSAQKKRESGITLVEVMLAIGIFGILIAIALPNFTQMIVNQRVRSASSDMFATLLYARSEAIKRNASIYVCSDSGDSGNPAWQDGWSVRTTICPHALYTTAVPVLKKQDAFTNITISNSGLTTQDMLVFGANGRPLAGSSGSFMVYPTSTPDSRAHCISLSLSGMPSTTVDTDSDRTNGC